jgi:GNAT superfamily N-acetyltransferase
VMTDDIPVTATSLPAGIRLGGYEPGALGAVCALQAAWYGRHWGFGKPFETKVAREMAAFLDRFDDRRDLFLTAWRDDRLVGAVALDGDASANRRARLRWFVVAAEMQGQGLGHTLLGRAMAFARERGYVLVWLATFAGLDTAQRLYLEHGFRLVGEETGAQWGRSLTEQVMEAVIDAPAAAGD